MKEQPKKATMAIYTPIPNRAPNYQFIIPFDVRRCNKISGGAKVLYSTLWDMCLETGQCAPIIKELAQKDHVTTKTIGRWLKELESVGFIAIEYVSTRIFYRKITCNIQP